MQTPPEREQPATPAPEWLPLISRTITGKTVAHYNPTTNEIAVSRRWHGDNIRAVGPLPDADPILDDWVPVVGVNFRVRLCFYNPSKHQVKISFRRYGSWIEDRLKLPARRAPANADDTV